jgi:hypothetical protein
MTPIKSLGSVDVLILYAGIFDSARQKAFAIRSYGAFGGTG